MIELDIGGYGLVQLTHMVFDINGTLTTDGALIEGVAERLAKLSTQVEVQLLTADTRGTATALAEQLGVACVRIPAGGEVAAKRAHVLSLGGGHVVAIGNGNNDVGMLKAARVGVVIVGDEGAATKAVLAADVVARNINDALDLFLDSVRLLSTLRC